MIRQVYTWQAMAEHPATAILEAEVRANENIRVMQEAGGMVIAIRTLMLTVPDVEQPHIVWYLHTITVTADVSLDLLARGW